MKQRADFNQAKKLFEAEILIPSELFYSKVDGELTRADKKVYVVYTAPTIGELIEWIRNNGNFEYDRGENPLRNDVKRAILTRFEPIDALVDLCIKMQEEK